MATKRRQNGEDTATTFHDEDDESDSRRLESEKEVVWTQLEAAEYAEVKKLKIRSVSSR